MFKDAITFNKGPLRCPLCYKGASTFALVTKNIWI